MGLTATLSPQRLSDRHWCYCISALLIVVVAPRVIDYDKVAPLPATSRKSIENSIASMYQPQIYINSGCHPYPAVNAKGDTSGGLDPTGWPSAKCKRSRLGTQVYGRSAWYEGAWAIMYSWYFPKDSPVAFFGHRHDWDHVIVWIDNPINFPGKILAASFSQHGDYSTYAPPSAETINGTSVKVDYNFWGKLKTAYPSHISRSWSRHKHFESDQS